MASNTPAKIGKYDVLEVVGRGGMGIVYKATDPDLGRLVAIKMMTAGFAHDPDLLKRFFREAQSTGSLQHPNIVTVYELGDHGGNPYLVMEFLEGESLDSIITSNKPLTFLEKINLIIGVAHGLSHAHRRGIVHRDIKPANIMVSKDGGVKIVDFGIAHIGAKSVTRTGQIVGSIIYMAPEQVNAKPVDVRSDIFSVGVVLYQLITSHHPFDGESTAATLLKIINEPPPPLSKFLSSYPAELETIILKALAKDRDERYMSVDDLALDLSQLQGQLKQEFISKNLEEVALLMEMAELQQAKARLIGILNVDRQNTDANLLLREVQQRIQREEIRSRTTRLVEMAEEAFAKEQFETALGHVDSALALQRNDPDLLRLRESIDTAWSRSRVLNDTLKQAEVAYQAGDLDAARQAAEEALEWAPNNIHAQTLHRTIQRDWNERARQRELESFLKQARQEINVRNFTSALVILKRADALDPGSPQVSFLIESAKTGREQERRRREPETISREVEEALNADDYLTACRKANAGLERYPGDRTLLKLKALAERQRQIAERKQFVDERLAFARTLLAQRRNEELLGILEEALAKTGPEPRLQSLLLIVRDNVQHERLERQKAGYLQKARDALRQKKFEEGIQILQSALKQFRDSADIADLLQFAKEEAAAEKHRQMVEEAIQKANDFIAHQEYGPAIELLEATLEQAPDEELRIVVTETRRASIEFQKRLDAILSNAEKLLQSGKATDAARLLELNASTFPHSTTLHEQLKTARRESERLRKIDEAINSAKRALESADFVAARSLLEECRRVYGSTPDLEQNLEAVSQQHSAASAIAVEAALTEARQLVTAGEHQNALDKLGAIAASLPIVNDSLKSEVEAFRRQILEGILGQKVAEIEGHIGEGRLTQAEGLLQQSLREFSGSSDLLNLQQRVREEATRKRDAQQALAEAQARFAQAEWHKGGEFLGKAFQAASASSGLREQVLAAFTQAAESALEKDWHAAEDLLRQRSELQPDYVVPAELAEKLKRQRRQQFANNDFVALLLLDRIDEATQRQSAGDLEGALHEVERGLNAYGNDSRLLKLRSEIQLQIDRRNRARLERERTELDAYVDGTLKRSGQEQDLEQQISVLEEGLAKYPQEPRLLRQVADRRELSKKIAALAAEAAALEGAGRYKEAIDKWFGLRGIFSSYPELNSNLVRLQKLDEQARDAAQATWVREVQDALSSFEFDRATALLEQGRQEFGGIPQFSKFQKDVKDGLSVRNKALRVVDDARGALLKKKWSKVNSYLERATVVSGNDPLVREQVLIGSLEACDAALNVDQEWAEKFLSQAAGLQPNSPLIAPRRTRVEAQRREQIIERRITAAVRAQSRGDLRAAVHELESGLAEVSSEPRLSQFKTELEARIQQQQDQLHAAEQASQPEQGYRSRQGQESGRQAKPGSGRQIESTSETRYEGSVQEEAQPQSAAAGTTRPQQLFGDTVVSQGLPPSVDGVGDPEKSAVAIPGIQLNTRAVVIGLSAALAVGILLMAWKLTPHAVAVQFRTTPEGATVRVKGTGQECTTPNCSFKLRPGQYAIEARLAGYETAEVTIAVNEWGASSEPIHLKSLPAISSPPLQKPAQLAIQGAPSSAEVLLDGKSLGRTNAKGSFTATVQEGLHEIRIQAKNREPVTIARNFSAGGNVVLNKRDLSTAAIVKPEATPVGSPVPVSTPEELDWQRIKNSASIDDWEKFRQRYPNGKYADVSDEKLDSLYWDKAKKSNTAPSFEEYLNKFPNGTHRDEGRESLAWNKANSTNTVPALRDFLKQYPQGQHNELAARRMEEMRFEAAKTSDDEALLEGFLKDYPAGDLHSEISRHLDDVVWEKTNKNDMSKLRSYLARFPDGRYTAAARSAIEKAAPAPVAKATPAVVDEKSAVLAVIAQYNRAYNDRNIEALRQVWPNMTHQQVSSLGDFFRTATAVQVTYSVSDVQVNGSDAVVTQQQSVAYEVSGGWQKGKPVRQVVRLRKTGSNPGDTAWKIDSVQ